MAHADILDQPERLKASFWGSVAMHAAIVAALIVNGVAGGPHERWGSKNGGGGFGAVAVNTVAQIPLPGQTGPENPVANPTESQVPTPPPKTKASAKTKAPEPDAIPLKGKNKSRKAEERAQEAAAPNKWREKQKDLPNQLYSSGGQAMSSSMFGKAGSGGLGMGSSSPFGTQLGWYADQLQDRVAQHWRTDDVPPQIRSAPRVIVSFTLRRDGSLAGTPQIKQSSGVLQLDRSAQRAILESIPFAAIPASFPRNQADVELTFELRR